MVPRKTRHKRLRTSEKPILPALADVLAQTPVGDLTFLVTDFGKPDGFGNWFRKRCNEAGLPHCTAHGLRKAGVTIAAENGGMGRAKDVLCTRVDDRSCAGCGSRSAGAIAGTAPASEGRA